MMQSHRFKLSHLCIFITCISHITLNLFIILCGCIKWVPSYFAHTTTSELHLPFSSTSTGFSSGISLQNNFFFACRCLIAFFNPNCTSNASIDDDACWNIAGSLRNVLFNGHVCVFNPLVATHISYSYHTYVSMYWGSCTGISISLVLVARSWMVR